jgi:acyl-CoA reductase-like NAD-dependent aldehyde dehydrogenase
MDQDPDQWSNRSPGDLETVLPTVTRTPLEPALEKARESGRAWARTPRAERAACLLRARDALAGIKESLAEGISLETGKPLTEARGEVEAVLAKFSLTLGDGEEFLPDRAIADAPHPSTVRRLARGPAAVIAPFNFPLHLGHGAHLAYLLAGNTVLFKPSPLAAGVAGRYAECMAGCFPEGVFQCIQGGSTTGYQLALDPRIRAVCFTGSATVGRILARELAADLGKDLALELGGKNAALVFPDADLDHAASAVAQGACLTAGQRCNATSRVIVHADVRDAFLDKLVHALASYVPGLPLDPATKLGPLISEAAVARYTRLTDSTGGTWLVPGAVEPVVLGKRGHYVRPAVVLNPTDPALRDEECFAPILGITTAADEAAMVELHEATPYALTASLFTSSSERFERLSRVITAGNLYANLATTFSPSALPFGGLKNSGNGHPGGRGFIRFTTDEQAIQIATDSLDRPHRSER